MTPPTAKRKRGRLDAATLAAAHALLPLTVLSWTYEQMRELWGASLEQADQWEATLIAHGMLYRTEDGRYRMPRIVRERMLSSMLDQGEVDEAWEILQGWLSVAEEQNDRDELLFAFEHVANVHTLRGEIDEVVAIFERCIEIHRQEQELAAVAHTSWKIGIVLARVSQLERARLHFVRAVAIAGEHDFPEIMNYRQALEALSDDGNNDPSLF